MCLCVCACVCVHVCGVCAICTDGGGRETGCSVSVHGDNTCTSTTFIQEEVCVCDLLWI